MKVSIKNGKLVIEMDLQSPKPFASGKTCIVASTGGFVRTEAQYEGVPVSIAVNACVPR